MTDPVELIPFPNQSLREKLPAVPKVLAPPIKSPLPPTTPEQQLMSIPTGQLNTNTLSVKKMLEKKEGENAENRSLENQPQQAFTLDQVKMLWRRFAFEMKEKGMETFYNAMIKREPIQQEETHFVMDVDNQIQVDYITPHLPEMMNYFRKELKNYAVEISIILNENPEEQTKFLTGKDKFAALARKNPNLHTLKSVFNLDIEF